MTIRVPRSTPVLPFKFFVCPACGKAFAARVAVDSPTHLNSIACIYCDFTQHQKDFKRVRA